MTYKEYDELKAKGAQAQAYVGSVLRGGFVYEDFFYFVGVRREKMPLTAVRELKFAPY